MNTVNGIMYKVLRKKDELLFSCNQHLPNKYIIQYEVGKLVKPPIGCLFVFDSLSAAAYFVSFEDVIYKCQATNCRPLYFIPAFWKDIETFWNKPQVYVNRRYPPVGTYISDSLTLLEEVKFRQ